MPVNERADALRKALVTAELRPAPPPPRPTLTELPDALREEVLALYRQFGGIQDAPKLCPGPWDLAFDGLVVELDEAMHFNRYRAATLTAPNLPWTDDYLDYCARHEGVCLNKARVAGRWTNKSCENMFGSGASPGDLAGKGAPRWKQRALYDAMKDLTPRLPLGVRLARVSVYDTIHGTPLDAILRGTAVADLRAIGSLVEARTA